MTDQEQTEDRAEQPEVSTPRLGHLEGTIEDARDAAGKALRDQPEG